ncbi:hypothetical protein AC579_7134 [Pseudocercospora musae]|uniref:Uncharacterized protein n=1 Tax=Pseudocercospora musae TaxID=113226 RepID=A0A139INC2_9PEZI|nr:hypothetical protein AC579_7134 [Pseudocercospora musae]
MSNAPTLINLPPPPSEPLTPSDAPGTPNSTRSTTTSMSELSTVAIKDGHRGHLPHHQHAQGPSGLSNQLDAERADRISRLAGLERVTTARNPQTPNSAGHLTPGASGGQPVPPAVSYFDSTGNPALGRERSTVGSASATGSVGARTTWAGDSEAGTDNYDKMSESQDQDLDVDNSSVGGMSEEGTPSLVAFGEGARTPARQSTISSSAKGVREARYIDGMTYDQDVVDTTADARRNTARTTGAGADQAERIMREHMDTTSNDRMREGAGQGPLGKFGFEK